MKLGQSIVGWPIAIAVHCVVRFRFRDIAHTFLLRRKSEFHRPPLSPNSPMEHILDRVGVKTDVTVAP